MRQKISLTLACFFCKQKPISVKIDSIFSNKSMAKLFDVNLICLSDTFWSVKKSNKRLLRAKDNLENRVNKDKNVWFGYLFLKETWEIEKRRHSDQLKRVDDSWRIKTLLFFRSLHHKKPKKTRLRVRSMHLIQIHRNQHDEMKQILTSSWIEYASSSSS